LKNRYQTIEALNEAWGNVFWSMEYNSFDQVELPLYAVTETSPAARLDYRRFSSDQVAYFHDEMIKVIRKHSPDRFITHNFIPMNETYVDNFDLAKHLDFASYDNYPLGRSDLQFADWPAEKFQPFMRTGHPDFACYYHDQTRGLTNGGFWIMEQQPGPVNWAGNNPNPAPDMVKLWSMEAFAHGADTLCYFRWRQAPFAQEQMHAGLLRPNSTKDTAYYQAEQVRDLLQKLPIAQQVKGTSPVAIVTRAEAQWVTEIERQSDSYDYNKVQFSYYSALRKLGLNVDFISTDHDLDEYRVVLVPALPVAPDSFLEKVKQTSATVVFGPRSGAKTDSFNLPDNLAPGKLQQLVNIQITAVETTRPDCPETLVWNNKKYESHTWREMFDLGSNVVELAHHQNNDAPNLAPAPVLVQQGHVYYLASLTCDELLKDFFRSLCKERAIGTYEYGEHVRVVTRGRYRFAFNYESHAVELPVAEDAIVHGSRVVAPRDFAIWQVVG